MINILFLAFNPIDRTEIDKEIRLIEEKIKLSKERGKINFIKKFDLHTGDLIQSILETNPNIIHFSGETNDEGSMIFKNEFGKNNFISSKIIGKVFEATCEDLKLVIFNVSSSDMLAKEAVKYVDYSIGMNAKISDKFARSFSSQFYSSLGFNKKVDEAFNQAKANLGLEILEGVNDIPVLYKKVVRMDNDQNLFNQVKYNNEKKEVIDYLNSKNSVSLVTRKKSGWKEIVNEICYELKIPIIDFQDPCTYTRKGLIQDILMKVGMNSDKIPAPPEDLNYFSKKIKEQELTYLCFVNFDMVSINIQKNQFDNLFFKSLRHLTMENFYCPKKLVIFFQSHKSISDLVPNDHLLSKFEIKSVFF